MPRFGEGYPSVTQDLSLDDQRVNLVEEGFDVALRGSDRVEVSGLISRKLMVLEHALCGSPAYFEKNGNPRRPEDLATHSCVQLNLSDHAAAWTLQKGIRTANVPVNGRNKMPSDLALRDTLRAGLGLIVRMYVKAERASGRLCPDLTAWAPNVTATYAVYPSKKYVVPKMRMFLDFLVEALGHELQATRWKPQLNPHFQTFT